MQGILGTHLQHSSQDPVGSLRQLGLFTAAKKLGSQDPKPELRSQYSQ